MKYSIIILLEEQQPDFLQFIRNLKGVFSQLKKPWEILIIANGTGGFLRGMFTELESFNHRIKAFEFGTKTTQAVCLKAALNEVSGETLVICGSYQQISNDSFIRAIESLDDEIDIVCPNRQKRVDPSFNQLQSRLFNLIVRKIVKTNLHDLSCTVRICRRKVLEETMLYGNMYRFLPVLAAQKGFKTKEVICDHYQERGKTGLYNLSDYISRIIDIFTLYFNTRFVKKPLRFFSSVGLVFILAGAITTLLLFVQRFLMDIPIGNRPALFITLLMLIFGVLVASVGLLGEIIVFTHGRHRKDYTVEKQI